MPDRALYLRIADDIADDIRSGRLAEGRPVPSTRRIVRDWGVAMATATKVIGALRAEGLVETIPGSGTIVRRRDERPAGTAPRVAGERSRRAGLTQREIVEAAVRIADAEGLPFVTMRRVAVSLGVSTMALYRHVPNRSDLTLRMADHVFAGARVPEIPMAAWRRRLEAVAHLFWSIFGRHPWAADVFSLSRPQLMPNVLPIAEWSLSTLRAMGFDAHDMLCAHINLFGHVRSMALVRLVEAQAEDDTGVSADDWMRLQGGGLRRWASSADHPGLGYVVREQFDFDLDVVFEYGLQRMLDGIDTRRRALGLPG
ncbi:TetR/AcrR family transcriptional regulator C-terminal domain-containing protein [Microbispora sp. RL4-1S]|uniref:TetR/AcrR family transcriptional regulator C-terminal domain-containing protein n=1 Tax=Microbispora oryzae TaxID=2806554 RepID=A0A941ALJ8_9ACTN|nr:TetR/AcrR family transcriptional regulator C-terminal domain-containing protein [Microbispora oryzae]MBP2706348.1 TetR/AcrR family transcriptional regulator C-terminal domain-containing protein [Microbispora oryzae]